MEKRIYPQLPPPKSYVRLSTIYKKAANEEEFFKLILEVLDAGKRLKIPEIGMDIFVRDIRIVPRKGWQNKSCLSGQGGGSCRARLTLDAKVAFMRARGAALRRFRELSESTPDIQEAFQLLTQEIKKSPELYPCLYVKDSGELIQRLSESLLVKVPQ